MKYTLAAAERHSYQHLSFGHVIVTLFTIIIIYNIYRIHYKERTFSKTMNSRLNYFLLYLYTCFSSILCLSNFYEKFGAAIPISVSYQHICILNNLPYGTKENGRRDAIYCYFIKFNIKKYKLPKNIHKSRYLNLTKKTLIT